MATIILDVGWWFAKSVASAASETTSWAYRWATGAPKQLSDSERLAQVEQRLEVIQMLLEQQQSGLAGGLVADDTGQ